MIVVTSGCGIMIRRTRARVVWQKKPVGNADVVVTGEGGRQRRPQGVFIDSIDIFLPSNFPD